jgi:hypothetical protein
MKPTKEAAARLAEALARQALAHEVEMTGVQALAVANNLIYCFDDEPADEMTVAEFVTAVRSRLRDRPIVRWSADRGDSWRASIDGMPACDYATWSAYWDDGEPHYVWASSPEETLAKLDEALCAQ